MRWAKLTLLLSLLALSGYRLWSMHERNEALRSLASSGAAAWWVTQDRSQPQQSLSKFCRVYCRNHPEHNECREPESQLTVRCP